MKLLQPRTWFASEQKDRSFDEIVKLMFSNTVSSGENVTPDNALKCSTVHAIVRALTNAVGSYPLMVFKETQRGDGKVTVEPKPKHAIMRLLKNPNRIQTQTVFFRRLMTHLALWGNHVSIKGQGQTGPISFLRPVHPDSVTIEGDDELNPKYRITFKDGERTFPANRILHVTGGISVDGVWAKSPVKEAAEAIGLCLAAERMLSELYGNNAIPSYLLTGGQFSSKEQYDNWVNAFRQVYGAGAQRGGVAMLPEGMDAKEVTFKPIDAQLLEARKFQRTEIASVWGVPPHKLADLERATFSNIEHQSLEFMQDVALPYVRLIEQAMERDLLTEADRKSGIVIRFDLDAAERADFKTRVEGYAKLHSVGAMSPNEIRAREGMNPREDEAGDEYVTPLNMRTTADENDSEVANDDEGVAESPSDDEPEQTPVRAV